MYCNSPGLFSLKWKKKREDQILTGWKSSPSGPLLLDPPPNYLTCSHQSTALIGSPKDMDMERGGGEGKSQRECKIEKNGKRQMVFSSVYFDSFFFFFSPPSTLRLPVCLI